MQRGAGTETIVRVDEEGRVLVCKEGSAARSVNLHRYVRTGALPQTTRCRAAARASESFAARQSAGESAFRALARVGAK